MIWSQYTGSNTDPWFRLGLYTPVVKGASEQPPTTIKQLEKSYQVLYNNQMNAGAQICQPAMVYSASKPPNYYIKAIDHMQVSMI